MAADKLHRLWTDIKAEEPQETNIAIRNIYQRLRLYYGEDFRLRIDSAEGQGTTITLVIPVGVRMYKVMIVDDEPSIRTGLPKLIDWEAYDFYFGGSTQR